MPDRTNDARGTGWSASPVLRLAGLVALVTAGYYVGGLIGYQLRLQPFGISIIWPPNAILLAALMLLPIRRWWLFVLPLLPAHLHLVVHFQPSTVSVPTMLSQFVGNAGQAVLAALAMRVIAGFPPRLDTLRRMMGFIVLAAIVAPALASALAAWLFTLTGWVANFWLAWSMRFLTNVFATLTITPLILLTITRERPRMGNTPLRRYAEFSLLMTLLLAVGIPIFWMEHSGPNIFPALIYAPLPLLLWAAARFGMRVLSLSLLIVASLSLSNASAGRGPFALETPAENVTQLQLYLVAITLPLICLTSVLQERKRAVAALRRSEQEARSQLAQLTAIYETAPVGLAFVDTDLRFVKLNQQLADINGLSIPAHVGRTLREVLGGLADDVEPLYRRIIEKGQPLIDIEVRERAGVRTQSQRIWLTSHHAIKNEQGEVLGVSAVVQEITARKQAEEALRNIAAGVSAKTGETFFRSLAEHISSALQVEYAFICEVLDGNQRARTIASYVKGAVTDNFDYDLAGTPCEQVLRQGMGVYPQGIKARFPDDAMLQEMDVESYLGVCLKDAAGKAVGLMAVMSARPLADIEATQTMLNIFAARASAELERKQAEEKLRISEERYREVVESQTDLVCRFLADGTLTFVNEAYCRFFGRAREKIIGRKFLEFIPENIRAATIEFLARLEKERRPLEAEHEVILPDGSIGWHHWVNYAIVGSDGEVTEFQGIGRDITDRKKVEEANLKLAHAARLAMIGELTAVVAHELSQPLTAIHYNSKAAEMMLMKSKPPVLKELREIVADIRMDNQRASESVRRMRTLLRRQQLEWQSLQLTELVEEVLRMTSAEAVRRRIDIKMEQTAPIPPVTGDRVHLQQVLLNLILNGMDAMADTPDSDRCLWIQIGRDRDGHVEVAVTDAGRGISPEKLPRIFESFYTTKKDGMGLGLSIAKSIIEAHRGRIWAENEEKGGATFRFTLPGDSEHGQQSGTL